MEWVVKDRMELNENKVKSLRRKRTYDNMFTDVSIHSSDKLGRQQVPYKVRLIVLKALTAA